MREEGLVMRRLAVGGRDCGHGKWASDGCGRDHSGGQRVWCARDFSGSFWRKMVEDGEGSSAAVRVCRREVLDERSVVRAEGGPTPLQTAMPRSASRSSTAGEQVAGW